MSYVSSRPLPPSDKARSRSPFWKETLAPYAKPRLGRSLLDLARLSLALEDALNCPVDVMTPEGLRPRIRERVMNEAVPL